MPFHTMTGRYTVIQIEPLGFCHSDRADRYEITVADQILTICEGMGIDRFAVWGYSQGGAMACTVARASSQVGALICGGYNVFREPSPAWLARASPRPPDTDVLRQRRSSPAAASGPGCPAWSGRRCYPVRRIRPRQPGAHHSHQPGPCDGGIMAQPMRMTVTTTKCGTRQTRVQVHTAQALVDRYDRGHADEPSPEVRRLAETAPRK